MGSAESIRGQRDRGTSDGAGGAGMPSGFATDACAPAGTDRRAAPVRDSVPCAAPSASAAAVISAEIAAAEITAVRRIYSSAHYSRRDYSRRLQPEITAGDYSRRLQPCAAPSAPAAPPQRSNSGYPAATGLQQASAAAAAPAPCWQPCRHSCTPRGAGLRAKRSRPAGTLAPLGAGTVGAVSRQGSGHGLTRV